MTGWCLCCCSLYCSGFGSCASSYCCWPQSRANALQPVHNKRTPTQRRSVSCVSELRNADLTARASKTSVVRFCAAPARLIRRPAQHFTRLEKNWVSCGRRSISCAPGVQNANPILVSTSAQAHPLCQKLSAPAQARPLGRFLVYGERTCAHAALLPPACRKSAAASVRARSAVCTLSKRQAHPLKCAESIPNQNGKRTILLKRAARSTMSTPMVRTPV